MLKYVLSTRSLRGARGCANKFLLDPIFRSSLESCHNFRSVFLSQRTSATDDSRVPIGRPGIMHKHLSAPSGVGNLVRLGGILATVVTLWWWTRRTRTAQMCFDLNFRLEKNLLTICVQFRIPKPSRLLKLSPVYDNTRTMRYPHMLIQHGCSGCVFVVKNEGRRVYASSCLSASGEHIGSSALLANEKAICNSSDCLRKNWNFIINGHRFHDIVRLHNIRP